MDFVNCPRGVANRVGLQMYGFSLLVPVLVTAVAWIWAWLVPADHYGHLGYDSLARASAFAAASALTFAAWAMYIAAGTRL